MEDNEDRDMEDNTKMHDLVVERLMNEEVDINGVYGDFTPLIWAVKNGYLDILRRLLEKPGLQLDIGDHEGDTALHMACEDNRVSIVKLLVKDTRCGPSLVNKKNSHDHTPLMIAVRRGHLDVVRTLLEHPGVELDIGDYYGNTVLHQLASDFFTRTPVVPFVKMICQDSKCSPGIINKKNRDGHTPLILAGHAGLLGNLVGNLAGHLDIVRTFLEHPGIKLGIGIGDCGNTALHMACISNNVPVMKLLCQDNKCSPGVVNKKNSEGYTTLMLAVECGHIDIVKELDIEGTDFSIRYSDGSTLMEVARRNKRAEVLKYLIERNKVDNLEVIAAHNITRYVKNKTDFEALGIPKDLRHFLARFVDEDY